MTDYPQDQSGEGERQPYSGQQPSGQLPYSGQPNPPPPPSPGPAPSYGQPQLGAVSPSDARMWSLFAHLGGLLLSPIVPLVIYLIYKDRDPFIRLHSAQALNFQIWVYIAYAVSVPLVFLLGLGVLTAFAAGICSLVFSIMAAIAANGGQEYRYPVVPQLIS